MATLSELMAFLEARLELPQSSERDVPLLWRPAEADKPLHHLALALEFSQGVAQVAADCDVLFLHRPFQLPTSALTGTPVLASHVGFDTHLTTGFNLALAGALGLREINLLFRGDRPGEALPIGMVGILSDPVPLSALQDRIVEEFGGLDEAAVYDDASVVHVAVMNALNPALIALASEHGATVCLTGQMRESARDAAQSHRVSVFAAGHARTERWGLRRLGQEIRQAFPSLETTVLEA